MSQKILKSKEKEDTRFFDKALEYFDRFNNITLSFEQPDNLNESSRNKNPNLLRDQMLNELNNLKEIIINNPVIKFNNLSIQEKGQFQEFIKFYSICPICGNKNHYNNLRKIYFDDEKQSLKEHLLVLMNFKDKKYKNLNLNFGIPCCSCYKLFFKIDNANDDDLLELILF